MEIVLVNTAMKFGPKTPSVATLGGSETAVLMAAKELRKLGHIVNVFTPLPEKGRPDYVPSGFKDEDGVRYIDFADYPNYIGNTEVDLLIVCRDPRAIATTSHAKKRVLWMHDIATHRGAQQALDQMAWTFDEIWSVSEWHRQQIHEVTGYPLKNIVALRNGIVPVEVSDPPFRLDKTLVYAARPERGLANLIKPGGVMEHLPEYTLKLCMYQNANHDLQEFYKWCWHRVQLLPNVEMPQPLSQPEMRQLLADATAYCYPTQFEETSCILARECIEQRTPFLTTQEGALPETLDGCAFFFEQYLDLQEVEEPEKGSPEWCKLFADYVRWTLETDQGKSCLTLSEERMCERTDLYWDGVAAMMIENASPAPGTDFSRAYSLVQDGDVIAARHLLLKKFDGNDECMNWAEMKLLKEIEQFYPFILDKDDPRYESLANYYKRFYAFKDHELNIDQQALDAAAQSPRFELLSQELEKLAPGSTVIEYGCGEGHVIVPAALKFPHLRFIAFDQVQANIDKLSTYPCGKLPNLDGYRVDTPEDAAQLPVEVAGQADAAICFEVLEHCVEPWTVAQGIEAMVKPGGRVIMMTPYGPWEPQTFAAKADEYHWRNHIWLIDKNAIRTMFADKPNMTLAGLTQNIMRFDAYAVGNSFFAYDADHEPVKPLDLDEKIANHRARQTVAAAVIAYNNEDTILRMLNSLDRKVAIVQIAHGPSTDKTLDIIEKWRLDHPHIYVNVIDAPKIEAPKEYGGTADEGFGFDDARNLSIRGLEDIADWVLWIDTDEYLAGYIGVYLRNNCYDGYLIPQHHFTVEPRGAEIQIDRPARLFRSNRSYKARGHIHEHFEIETGGPGHCFMLPDVDIGHTGYVNEETRRARFERNFPFLRWEHEEGSQRKLHPFLWFRDIVHRMRYAHFNGNKDVAYDFAKEAEAYFTEHKKDMANFGAGLPTALQYISEVRKLLGIGVPLQFSFKLDDRQAGLEGVFLEPEELWDILREGLVAEFKRRKSKYY